jgi:hypothetical protein
MPPTRTTATAVALTLRAPPTAQPREKLCGGTSSWAQPQPSLWHPAAGRISSLRPRRSAHGPPRHGGRRRHRQEASCRRVGLEAQTAQFECRQSWRQRAAAWTLPRCRQHAALGSSLRREGHWRRFPRTPLHGPGAGRGTASAVTGAHMTRRYAAVVEGRFDSGLF